MKFISGIILTPVVCAMVAPAAMATVYLSPEQAIGVIFPGRKVGDFKATGLKPSGEQRKAIKAQTGLSVRDKEIRVWTAADGTRMYVDQVVGKHDFITFATGIGADGKVRGVEILEYRETYGGEVRRPEWRKQFQGKSSASGFKLGKDIMNISGATLSSHSITDGVYRLLALRDLTT